MEGKSIGVLLADKRQDYIAEILKKWGYLVYARSKGEEKLLLECQNIILPTPFALSEDRSCGFIYKMREGQMLFSSKIPKEVIKKLEEKKVKVFDFLEEEEIALQNAQITAEGIIAEAMMKYRGVIHKTSCLVLGYGKCGKAIAKRLRALGAKVTVCTNAKKEIYEAKREGFLVLCLEKLTLHKRCMGESQLIFHTIPVSVLSREYFSNCSKESIVFDIVSTRVEDKKWAMEYGIDYEIYPKIPEKYAPKAAAMIFAKYVERKICDR